MPEENETPQPRIYPDGRIAPEDDGAFEFKIGPHKGRVIVEFARPIRWAGFKPDDAIRFALGLIMTAREVQGSPVTFQIGGLDFTL